MYSLRQFEQKYLPIMRRYLSTVPQNFFLRSAAKYRLRPHLIRKNDRRGDQAFRENCSHSGPQLQQETIHSPEGQSAP
jgi:hypothetical protein